MTEVRAIQRTARQSPYKMRLVIDQIRGKDVNEALALLQFSKKHAAQQIEKVLQVGRRERRDKGREANEPVDVDTLYVKHAVINEGPKLKRFMPAAMGRATPIQKRTSHVEIVVAPRAVREPSRPSARRSGGREGASGSDRQASQRRPSENDHSIAAHASGGDRHGTEDQSDRVSARHLQAVALAVVRQPRFPAAPQGRRAAAEVPEGAPRARGDRRHPHRAQAGQGGRDDPHRASGRGDREEGRGGRQAARRADAARRARKSGSTSRRSSVRSSTRSWWPTTSRTSWRSASRSAGR